MRFIRKEKTSWLFQFNTEKPASEQLHQHISVNLLKIKMKYRVIIEKDEDGIFVAECPSLPGCISQGKTRAGAMKNIKDAVKGYLKSLTKHKGHIPCL